MQAQDERLEEGRGSANQPGASTGVESNGSSATEVQRAFPSLWKHVRPTSVEQFAHQAERDFSAILDYYRVRWAYEPTSFPLRWDATGRPLEMFTPDFYLPDHRLYIEMTTMRQSLVTRKNRKLRQLRELYPDIRVKLLYRRDYQQLVDVFIRPAAAGAKRESIGRVVFDEIEIARRIDELAAEIATGYPEERPVLLVVGAGTRRFAAGLVERLHVRGHEADVRPISISRARPGRRSPQAHARVSMAPGLPLAGRRVLAVTDVVSTGLSMDFLRRWAIERKARDFAVCALLDRPEARITEVPVRFAAFSAPAELVVGFGMQLRPRFADLGYIATLNSETPAG